ncbi:MAG: hypothetical protein JW762_13355 [Dehalococcoidales bacterium]|nr:hypothetical protein [Dehalococcoidales bacterium]
MDDVFDLVKISRLIESEHPSCIAIVDTNILMNEPDPNNWQLPNVPTVFIISDGTIIELEYIRKKKNNSQNKEKEESREKAAKAIRNLANLFKTGSISDGISITNGWIVGVPTPNRKILDEQLDELKDIVEAFDRSDTKLLLLTRECSETFTNTPVVFLTADNSLFEIFHMNGVPCHLCTGFPMEIREFLKPKPINWEQVLDEIQEKTEQNSIEVEVTLKSKKVLPDWLVDDSHSMMVAEGWGVIRDKAENISFLWAISFGDLSANNPESSEDNSVLKISQHLDFLGAESVDEYIIKAIAEKLANLVIPNLSEATPTLQNPSVVIEYLLVSEYSEEGKSQEEIDSLERIIVDTDGEYLADGWIDLILDYDQSEIVHRVFRIIRAIKSCWQIGDKYTFRILNPDDINVDNSEEG